MVKVVACYLLLFLMLTYFSQLLTEVSHWACKYVPIGKKVKKVYFWKCQTFKGYETFVSFGELSLPHQASRQKFTVDTACIWYAQYQRFASFQIILIICTVYVFWKEKHYCYYIMFQSKCICCCNAISRRQGWYIATQWSNFLAVCKLNLWPTVNYVLFVGLCHRHTHIIPSPCMCTYAYIYKHCICLQTAN